MNTFLDRIARLYAPLGQRGLLMDGQYRFAPDRPTGKAEPRRSAPVGVSSRTMLPAKSPRSQAHSHRGLLQDIRWHAY